MSDDPLILRDHLAIDRTALANERTLLAYVRTGVALAAAGFGLIHLTPTGWADKVGVLSIVAGVVVVALGLYRFAVVARRIRYNTVLKAK